MLSVLLQLLLSIPQVVASLRAGADTLWGGGGHRVCRRDVLRLLRAQLHRLLRACHLRPPSRLAPVFVRRRGSGRGLFGSTAGLGPILRTRKTRQQADSGECIDGSAQITELDVALQSGIDIGDSCVQGRVEIYSCAHPQPFVPRIDPVWCVAFCKGL